MNHDKNNQDNYPTKNSVGRLCFTALCVVLQIGWLVLLGLRLNEYSTTISMLTSFAALFLALRIYGKQENAAFKMPWIILLLIFPVMGLCLYGMFGHTDMIGRKMEQRFQQMDEKLFPLLPQNDNVLKKLGDIDFGVANQCRYIKNYAKFPVYNNTDIVFYKDAAEGFEAQLLELEQAERFIFMEYHAIEEATAFARLKEVLERKTRDGVEVRLFYDDVGSVGFIDPKFIKRMEDIGVQCRVFNPLFPIFSLFMNNRDHRKITVIDGKVGFVGGYNLADEYFNITHPYGHWKDTGVKLVGEAVKNLTVSFLEMWNAVGKGELNKKFDKYLPDVSYVAKEDCYVQPYSDSPLDHEHVGENVYLNMIKNAKHRLYVATPYLIISDDMERELGLAAKRGVDVRVITPGIPDKKLVFKITQSYYAGLVCRGVRIYEYTPGFIHEKQMLCDDDCATVGTINLDYRSLYHHFENGVFIYRSQAVKDIADDFEETLQKCTEVTEHYREGQSVMHRGTQGLLRMIAPLL